MVEVIDLPDEETCGDLTLICDRIREVVSSGRAVALVPSSNDPKFEWTEKCINRLAVGLAKGRGNNILLNWQSE